MNRRVLASLMIVALAACGPKPAPVDATPTVKAAAIAPAEVGTLAWAIQGPWRLEPGRDPYQHPAETLTFFGLGPNMTVVEILPGRGWYTSILAPYLAKNGGKLYAASYDPQNATEDQRAVLGEYMTRFLKYPETFGTIQMSVMSPSSGQIAPPGSADLVLAINNVNAFMAEGYAEQAFKSFFVALKPGGVLGVEQHRARSNGLQDPQAGAGYVQEEYIKLLAKEAGFEFVGASEINSNPKDTKDHPFGVWTLPPVLRTAPLGMDDDPHFDSAKYVKIGESDRMTLKFRKPAGGHDALRGPTEPDVHH